MQFLHFDEAKQAAVAAVKTWVGPTSQEVRALLIVDLFGKLRLVIWEHSSSDTTNLEDELVVGCGAWWTGEMLRFKELDLVTAKIYDSAWISARPDETEPRFRLHDRHRLERSLADAPLADYFHRCDRVAAAGEIIVFPAGDLNEDYADKLARIDLEEAPEAHDSGLWKLLTRVRDELKPKWILLDARTGISEPAGQLLSGIAHLHVLLGTTQDQSWQGLNLVLDRLGKQRVLVECAQAEVLLVQAMVPSGEPGKAAKQAFSARAEEEFDNRFYAAEEGDTENDDRFWTLGDKGSQDAPHAPMPVDYDSKLASFGDITEVADALCAGPYPPIVERIVSRFLTEPEA